MSARLRQVAMGDPQAPFEKMKAILDRQGLLTAEGRLRDDVEFTSMGDHFDWGRAEQRTKAADDALELLTWLASHPPEQVHLVLGNHDLARVGEMADFDDVTFEAVYAEAKPAYDGCPEGGDEVEHAFLRRWPQVPSAECVARDFGTFRVEQRELVTGLLRSRRFRIAFAPSPELLLLHAGVTRDELSALGLSAADQRDASRVAAALNGALDRAVDAWSAGRLAIPGLHRPGDALGGEGRGIFYHRPQLPEHGRPEHFAGPLRRRFDPRRLPAGLTQAVGHIRDSKCRTLIEDWAKGPAAGDGPLRSLVVRGETGVYRKGVDREVNPDAARVIFTDGGMSSAEVVSYELLDLATGQPWAR
jgi:hypothetical protein